MWRPGGGAFLPWTSSQTPGRLDAPLPSQAFSRPLLFASCCCSWAPARPDLLFLLQGSEPPPPPSPPSPPSNPPPPSSPKAQLTAGSEGDSSTSTSTGLAAGLGVGLGVPVLAALVGLLLLSLHRAQAQGSAQRVPSGPRKAADSAADLSDRGGSSASSQPRGSEDGDFGLVKLSKSQLGSGPSIFISVEEARHVGSR